MVKVNIGTALNIAFTEQVRGFLEEDAKVVDPRRYLVVARDALADVVAHLLSVLAGG
jgi:fructose-bisphosphate aldolase class II